VVNALYKTMTELQLDPDKTAIISGIGCSSRLPGYVNAYGFNAVHGRALPIASGVKMSNPEITTIVAGGDGDGLAIGMGHFPHAARRNLDITYIMMDNRIYGLTKGQFSPTSEPELVSKTSTLGNVEKPVDPVLMALSTGVTFVARTVATNLKHMTKVFREAIEHKGFSFIQVLSPCVTFRGKEQYKEYQDDGIIYLEDTDHNCESFHQAQALAMSGIRQLVGVIYHVHQESFMQRYWKVRRALKGGKEMMIREMVDDFLP